MKILNAPDVSDKHCRVFSFVASVRLPRPRRKDKSDAADKCRNALLDFLTRLSLRVLGADYVELIGLHLPFEYVLFEEEGSKPFRVEANVTCPLMYNLSTLQADVIAEWKASSLAGDRFFISHRPFKFGDVKGSRFGMRVADLPPSSMYNKKLDALPPLDPTILSAPRSRPMVRLA